MNPWWLRPPTEEAPSRDQKPQKPAGKTQEEQKPELKEKKAAPGQRRSGRGRGAKRRQRPADQGQPKAGGQSRIAVFYDVESIAQGVHAADIQGFDLDLILRRLAERGRLIAKRAYGAGLRDSDQAAQARAAGLEVVDFPQQHQAGKSSADIKLAVDAVELCLAKEPCEVFVIISGDGGFSPLVSKLQAAKAEVVGVGIRGSVSSDLAQRCDEYLYYDELVQQSTPPTVPDGVDEGEEPVFAFLVETIGSLQTGSEAIIWGSTLKQEMRRRQPGFDETGLGYATFTDLLEDAERHGVIHLERDDRSGGYYVAGIARQ